MARRGLRVLAAAGATWPHAALLAGPDLPASMAAFDFKWRGLVGFADPLRPGVPAAVADARAAGVRVIMLTGDHLETARAIAAQAGLGASADVVLGAEFDALDDEQLGRRIATTDVFARVRPEHKLRLVEALKRQGEVVAMTGDGVNDAPALLAAHVGIGMGGRGTDVAREAASIVLLDDNFLTVVRAIAMGRAIHDNIRRAVHYILAVHVPITGLALLPLLTGGPLILLPVHVVFLELIIDPACSIVFEREPAEPGIMRRPPRPRGERLVDGRSILRSLADGALMFAAVAAMDGLGRSLALPFAQAGALAFTALVAGNLGLIVLYRAGESPLATMQRRNPAFWIVCIGALCLLLAISRSSTVGAWFGFAPPPILPWLFALALPLALAWLLKALRNKRGLPAVAAAPVDPRQ
jgi:Ca2+-transporting ATPase